ncbi:hypothetical protein VTL71DRAFT_7807 [Oculimacula yallundae]|uniref:AA9 family lytic polysaccharide monooxygenase n=1 Tax=Oculimacula yallundae TaxID=86028 RepID=A0ABR4CY85_9HELO
MKLDIFWQLTYGGTKYPTYTYVRKNSNYNSPVTDLTSNDLRCNVGGASGSATDTLSVKAGGDFTFTADIAVYHQGATSIYMAKAPTTAKEYDGSGQSWFKIYEIGPVFKGSGDPTWPLYTTYSYRIPPATPNGEYLLRMEQLAIHNPGSTPQFYVSCAQISVTGGGAGNPGPLVSIPGHVKGTESGYTANIYNNFKSYTIVGPQVWAGQNDTSPVPAETTSTTAKPVVTSTSTTPVLIPTTLITTPVVIPTISSSKVCHIGTTSAMTTPAAENGGGGEGTIPAYTQCGGRNWTGSGTCVAGTTWGKEEIWEDGEICGSWGTSVDRCTSAIATKLMEAFYFTSIVWVQLRYSKVKRDESTTIASYF